MSKHDHFGRYEILIKDKPLAEHESLNEHDAFSKGEPIACTEPIIRLDAH